MTDDVKALVAELREDHYWVDGECGNRDCRAYAWPCPPGEAAAALEALTEERDRLRDYVEWVCLFDGQEAHERPGVNELTDKARGALEAQPWCPPARAAAALEAQQKRIEALERVVYVARLWCDEADCVPMAVEDALIVLDSLS